MLNLQGFAKTGDYLKVDNSYWLCIKDSGLYEINGTRDNINVGWNSSTKQFVLSEEPVLRKVTLGKQELSHYECEGDTLTVQGYQSINNKHLDEDGDRYYPSLEVEFEHRKELEHIYKFKAVYNQHEDTYEDIETRCVGDVVDTGSRFIENALSYGKATFSNSSFYRVNLSGITSSELSAFVDEYNLKDKYSNSTHSNVHFAQIDNQYIMTNLPYSNKDKFTMVTTLEEATKLEKDTRAEVRSHLNMKVLGGNYGLHGKTLTDTYSKVEQWMDTLQELDVKVKSDTKKRGLRNSMYKFKAGLKEILEKQL